jgi:hypothetical protein
LLTRQTVQDCGSPASIRRADIDEIAVASAAVAGAIEQFNASSILVRRNLC